MKARPTERTIVQDTSPFSWWKIFSGENWDWNFEKTHHNKKEKEKKKKSGLELENELKMDGADKHRNERKGREDYLLFKKEKKNVKTKQKRESNSWDPLIFVMFKAPPFICGEPIPHSSHHTIGHVTPTLLLGQCPEIFFLFFFFFLPLSLLPFVLKCKCISIKLSNQRLMIQVTRSLILVK